ncbi:MAG: recombination-associated protein RdgC [Enterovibrio sp.]
MWFKNIYCYRLTSAIELSAQHIEEQLAALRITPCGSQDLQKVGFGNALGKDGSMLTHGSGANVLLCAHKEEKMLPSSVIKEALANRVAKMEQEQGRTLKKAEKQSIKEAIILELLPRAFSRYSHNFILIMPQLQLILVDASSAKKAQDVLGLLRKGLGSLPVVPAEVEIAPETAMTEWVKTGEAATGFSLGEEAELKAPLEHSGTVRCKDHELTAEEILNHINAQKRVTKLALSWRDRVEFILCEDMALKRVKFSEELREQAQDVNKEDKLQALDADLALQCGEFLELLPDLFHALGGLKK